MEKIFDAITCSRCKEVLKTPIVLPCGHSMCKIHTDETGNQLICPKCGLQYRNEGFPINTELLVIIESQIGSIDFGKSHREAKDACDKLEEILDLINSIIKDPLNISREAIDQLKYQVLLKSEQLKFEIEEKTEKLISVLSEYGQNCELNFGNLKSDITILENFKKSGENILKESRNFLNNFKVDQEIFENIVNDCKCKVEEITIEIESFKNHLFVNQFEEKKTQVDLFMDVNLCSEFQWE